MGKRFHRPTPPKGVIRERLFPMEPGGNGVIVGKRAYYADSNGTVRRARSVEARSDFPPEGAR